MTPATVAALEHECLAPRSEPEWGHGPECHRCLSDRREAGTLTIEDLKVDAGPYVPAAWSPHLARLSTRDTMWPTKDNGA
jgi:hypothetical protein